MVSKSCGVPSAVADCVSQFLMYTTKSRTRCFFCPGLKSIEVPDKNYFLSGTSHFELTKCRYYCIPRR